MLKKLYLINTLIAIFLLLPFEKTNFPNDYLLSIPKINLKLPFYPNDERKNNLNYGIETLKSNDMYLLASHSGNGIHSYFKNLEKLEIGDEFFITFQNETFRYIIKEKNYKDKDGKLEIKTSKDNIILLTCSKDYPDKQVYFLGEKN